MVRTLFAILCATTAACGGGSSSTSGDAAVDATDDGERSLDAAADAVVDTDAIFIEALPASKNHRTATWWGYNQPKILRDGDRVVTYVLDNDVAEGAPYNIVMYQKTGDGPWTAGATISASAPGALLLEPSGQLSLFVWKAFDMAANGAWGSLRRYMFATPGDITNHTSELIVDNDGTSETVNIRVGAAVSSDGTIYAGWGINLPGEDAQSEVLYELAPGETDWTWSKAATQLGHDFYYPYVLPTEPGVAMLAVQDDYVPPELGGGNLYQMTRVFERAADTWTQTPLVDLTSLPIAATSKNLLQVSDFFQGSDGVLHSLTSLYLDGNSSGFVTETRHHVRTGDTWSSSAFAMPDGSCNFVRLFEVDGRLMSICQTYDKAFLRAVGGTKRIQLMFPAPITGGYPFVTTPRGGTSADEAYIDFAVISGDSSAFPDAPAFYVRAPKSVLRDL